MAAMKEVSFSMGHGLKNISPARSSNACVYPLCWSDHFAMSFNVCSTLVTWLSGIL
jgi:hypothetical protein